MTFNHMVAIFSLLFFCAVSAGSAAAQSVYEIPATDPYYDTMTKELVAGAPEFSFQNYRKNYAFSRRYDPLAEDIKKQMLNLAYLMQAGDDATRQAQEKKRYEALVYDHLANLGVVTLALSLSRDDPRFGSEKFFSKVQSGLFSSVLDSGTGTSLSNAYDVITIDEEAMLLRYLKIVPMNTISAHEGSVYYNMHDYQDSKTGLARTLFVNTKIPMEFFERQKRKEAPKVDLRRQ